MQTIGERLEDARKRKGISIREAAEATKIRGDYLQKFEGNHFDIGLTEIYVRGFLHNYAEFLKLPAERILNDFSALGHAEARPRQPSREVYGRMDVSVTSAEDRGERPAPPAPEPLPPAEAGRGPGQSPRSRASHPSAGLPIDPALIFKGGIVLVAVLVIALAVWVGHMLLSGSAKEADHDLPSATPAPVAAAPVPEPEAPLTFVATKPVKIKVAKQADDSVLFQGTLQAGDRQDFPNQPLYLSASAIENVQIEYKGQRYNFGDDKHPVVGYKSRLRIGPIGGATPAQP